MKKFSVNKIYVFYGILMVGFLLLLGRLFELQIILGSKYRLLAEENRIRKEIIPAPRGILYDRNKKPLVENEPIYRVESSDCEEGRKKCFKEITHDEALKIEIKDKPESGQLKVDIGRDYLYGKALVHVLGYLGEVSEEEIKKGQWQLGELIGRTGIEEKYEEILRGQNGGIIYEVDTFGNRIREISKIEPLPGKDLYLSIDGELSRAAYQALEGKLGAVIVTEAQTGQVIVLVSSPSFDPRKIKPEDLTDPRKPMFNRAIGGVYPPGSTFKIVSAAAGIEEGKIDENTIYEDVGFIKVGEYTYKNWYYSQYGKTEGKIDLIRAIKRSTDTFFYKVGEWVGARKLREWAMAFGLGRKTGIDLPGEAEGLVPSPEWKEKIKGEKWFLGNTYHFAIGQADLLATPLQINMMTSVIASGGKLCKPQVTLRVGERPLPKEDCQDLNLKPQTLKLIKEGMKEACSPGGTGFPFFNFSPQVACKTGTAEFGDPAGKTHAWFTAFAPFDKPEIVITILVEGGGEGAYVAAPIAKKILEKWFENRL